MRYLIIIAILLMPVLSYSSVWWTDSNGFDSRNVECHANGVPMSYNGITIGPDVGITTMTEIGLTRQTDEVPPVVIPPTPVYPTQAQVQLKLARAYNSYLNDRFNSVGTSILLQGVLQGKPKSIAVKAWVQQLSTDYYTRKAMVPATIDGTYTPNYDFSNNGEPPYSALEISQEVNL